MTRVQFTVGQLVMIGVSNGAVTVLARDSSNDVLMCKCATGSIPAAATGYAKGCLLVDTTTGRLYSNLGTTSSSSFIAAYGASPSSSASPSTSPSMSPSESPSESPSVSPS